MHNDYNDVYLQLMLKEKLNKVLAEPVILLQAELRRNSHAAGLGLQ